MRHPIWKKEDFFSDGENRKDMTADVVTIPEREIQIYGGFNTDNPPLGHATDIQKADGGITCEVLWFNQNYDGLIEDGYVRLAGTYDDIEMAASQVTKARLKSLALIAEAAVPSDPYICKPCKDGEHHNCAEPGKCQCEEPVDTVLEKSPEENSEKTSHAMYFDRENSEIGRFAAACTCGWAESAQKAERLSKKMKRHASETGHTKVMGS